MDFEVIIRLFNGDLGKAIAASDLFADYPVPTFVSWGANTANTPHKAGLTSAAEGFAICVGSVKTFFSAYVWEKAGKGTYIYSVVQGKAEGWSQYASKDDFGNPINLTFAVSPGIGSMNNDSAYAPRYVRQGCLVTVTGIVAIGKNISTLTTILSGSPAPRYHKWVKAMQYGGSKTLSIYISPSGAIQIDNALSGENYILDFTYVVSS